jgi:hypothetical protein
MKDMGLLHHFLEVTMERPPPPRASSFTITILERAGMFDCKNTDADWVD